MIKNNKKKVALILSGLFLLVGWFYWYEIRPSKIRAECSWVAKHSDAEPAIPPMSDEEIRAAGYETDCTSIEKGTRYEKIFGVYADLKIKSCEEKKIGRPAVAAKDWEVRASKAEYDFCIRSRGLIR